VLKAVSFHILKVWASLEWKVFYSRKLYEFLLHHRIIRCRTRKVTWRVYVAELTCCEYVKSDNKVLELATVCLPWKQWTETSVSFDQVGISAFYSYVVVDLWQSLSEWCLLLSECVLVCRRENVGAWIIALSVREFLANKQINVLEHSPYSPDLVSSDFFLFLKKKKILKEGILMTLVTSGVIRR
jgi:hypothetical protein